MRSCCCAVLRFRKYLCSIHRGGFICSCITSWKDADALWRSCFQYHLTVCVFQQNRTKTIKWIFCETCCTGSRKEEEEAWWISRVDLNYFLKNSEIVSLALADVLVLLLLTLEPVSKCEVNIRIISLPIIITLPIKCIKVFDYFSTFGFPAHKLFSQRYFDSISFKRFSERKLLPAPHLIADSWS